MFNCKLPSGITFNCNEQLWMIEELVVVQLREVWDRIPSALL